MSFTVFGRSSHMLWLEMKPTSHCKLADCWHIGSAHVYARNHFHCDVEDEWTAMQIADLEKAKTRLTQVFRAQVSGFREACYQMFGYQIDVTAEAAPVKHGKAVAASVYTLKPQHADDANAMFRFRMSSDQQLRLLPSKYLTSRLNKEVETFIDRYSCHMLGC